MRGLARAAGQEQIPAKEVKPKVAGREPESDKDNELPARSPEDDRKGPEHAIHNCQNNWSVRPAQVEKRPAQVANDILLRSSSTTPVVHMLVCSTILCRDFDSAREMSRLRFCPANLRWSHCS